MGQAQSLVGRTAEVDLLREVWRSPESELVALYGRRRVGKTFLIRSVFGRPGQYFEVTGLKDGTREQQLDNFADAMRQWLRPRFPFERPKSWKQAFQLLVAALDTRTNSKRPILLFFDELPWLSTHKGGMLQALDHAWNTELSRRPWVRLVACGSASSWMLDNLINAKGGLHNRVTRPIHLLPFSLPEARRFLRSRGLRLPPPQLLTLYLGLGGVPYYLRLPRSGRSAVQCLYDVCLAPDAPLGGEFERVFASLFTDAHEHRAIVECLAAHRYGLSRNALLHRLGTESGGTLSKRIGALEASGFIRTFVPYGRRIRDQHYRTVDEFTTFWLRFAARSTQHTPQSWVAHTKQPAWHAWAGYAFESLCYKHAAQLQHALGFGDVAARVSSWYKPGNRADDGAQIDLLYDCDDDTIRLCEVKKCDGVYRMDKESARALKRKVDVFEEQLTSRKATQVLLLTSGKWAPNTWSEDLIDQHVSVEEWLAN